MYSAKRLNEEKKGVNQHQRTKMQERTKFTNENEPNKKRVRERIIKNENAKQNIEE